MLLLDARARVPPPWAEHVSAGDCMLRLADSERLGQRQS